MKDQKGLSDAWGDIIDGKEVTPMRKMTKSRMSKEPLYATLLPLLNDNVEISLYEKRRSQVVAEELMNSTTKLNTDVCPFVSDSGDINLSGDLRDVGPERESANRKGMEKMVKYMSSMNQLNTDLCPFVNDKGELNRVGDSLVDDLMNNPEF